MTELEGLSTSEALLKVAYTKNDVRESDSARVRLAAPLLYNCYVQSRQPTKDVCLYCLLFEWCEAEIKEVSLHTHDVLTKDTPPNVADLLHAMARAHNKEQHSANGNIKTLRETFNRYVEAYRSDPTEVVANYSGPDDLLMEMEREWIQTDRIILVLRTS